jgi:hypothetical protein
MQAATMDLQRDPMTKHCRSMELQREPMEDQPQSMHLQCDPMTRHCHSMELQNWFGELRHKTSPASR